MTITDALLRNRPQIDGYWTTSLSLGLALATLSACTAPTGMTMNEAAPALDARVGMKDGELAKAFDEPWNHVSEAWNGTDPLQADAALRCAIANNRQLRRTLAELARRRALTQDAHLPPNPTINVAAGAPLDMGLIPVLAMVGQQVDWLWKRDAIVGDADAQLKMLLFESATIIIATTVEVRTAYIETASAIELVELAEADSKVAIRVLAAEEAAFQAGDGRAAAVNQARMNTAEASNRVMEASVALVRAKTRLLESIGRGDHHLEWSTADNTAERATAACMVVPPTEPESEESLHALVRERRLDLRAAKARVEGLQSRVSFAMAARWPTLMLGGGFERDMEGDQAAMFELESTIPLWNQGRYRIAAAEADLEAATIEEDRLWQRAVIDTRRALQAISAAEHHTANLRGVTLTSFNANKQILAAAVAAGDRSPIELWRSEHVENHVRIQVARAQRDNALAVLDLERSLAGTRLSQYMGGGMNQLNAGGSGGGMGAGSSDFEFTALETME